MSTVATKGMTAEEFFEFVHRPENRDRFFELDRGEIEELPPPKKPHGFVCGNVAGLLWVYSRQRGDCQVCTNDTGFVVERDPDAVRGPDVSVYEGVQALEEMPTSYYDQPPKAAVDVLSPNDTWARITRRLTQMLRAGVALIWIVDPEARNVTVHQPDKEPYVLEEGDEITGEDVLPGFRCRVAEFFALPGQA